MTSSVGTKNVSNRVNTTLGTADGVVAYAEVSGLGVSILYNPLPVVDNYLATEADDRIDTESGDNIVVMSAPADLDYLLAQNGDILETENEQLIYVANAGFLNFIQTQDGQYLNTQSDSKLITQ